MATEKTVTSQPSIDIHIGPSQRKRALQVLDGHDQIRLHAFQDSEILHGKFRVNLNGNARFDFLGIKIILTGTIDSLNDKSINTDFLVIQKEVEQQESLVEDKEYDFQFKFDKQHESFYGRVVRLSYSVRVCISKAYNYKLEQARQFAVILPQPELLLVPPCPVKLELGVDELLHLEISLRSGNVHVEDIIVGNIVFLLVQVTVKSMELQIIKQETVYTNPTSRDNEVLASLEIMDGCPAQGDTVPFRVNLRQVPKIAPTMSYVGGKFSVKYFISWQVIDQDGERYLKQHEINIYRAR